MSESLPFDGYNRRFEMPPYHEGDTLPAANPMFGYNNRVVTFTRWKLSARELEEITRTGEVWMASRTGIRPMQPHWVGSLSYIKYVCAEMGGLWGRSKNRPQKDDRENA